MSIIAILLSLGGLALSLLIIRKQQFNNKTSKIISIIAIIIYSSMFLIALIAWRIF